MTHTGGLTQDTQALMAFEAGKKSQGVSYLLWFFLGGFGGHRFYLGETGTAVAMLLLSIFGWLTIFFGLGLLLLIPLGIWLIVDLFLIPGMVQKRNAELMARLNVAGPAAGPSASSAVDELAKFAELRDKGAISDEEYEAQKARLLGAKTATLKTPEELAPES